jgi:hypothetical protein
LNVLKLATSLWVKWKSPEWVPGLLYFSISIIAGGCVLVCGSRV